MGNTNRASATPIRISPKLVFDPRSEVGLNAFASLIKSPYGVAIVEMHAKISRLIDMERSSGFDFADLEKKLIHPCIVAALS